jgi:hypothetical protein
MARPSIFSREYKRKMRARKIKVGFLIAAISIATISFFSRTYIKVWLSSNIDTVNVGHIDAKSLLIGRDKEQIQQEKTVDKKETDNKKSEDLIPNKSETIEKFYEVSLSEGKLAKVIYDETSEGKKIKYVSSDSNPYYNISPLGKNVVIYESDTQTMILVTSDGVNKDITKQNYISSDGSVFSRENEIKKNPSYIWCTTPKFIDEDTIIYISQLPWFGKTEKYIWKFEISDLNHSNIITTAYENIKFDKLSDKGLIVELDGKIKMISQDGKLLENQ